MLRSNALAAVALALLLGACQTNVTNHGVLPEGDVLARVQPGITRTEVSELLGTPTTIAAFDENTWLYVGRRTEQEILFLSPRVTDQGVLAITFGQDGRVAQVRRLGAQDASEFAFIDRATPSPGKELSIWEQFIGNLGRFNNSRTGRGADGGGGGR